MVGDAWSEMMATKQATITQAFVGVLNNINGSEDDKITWPKRQNRYFLCCDRGLRLTIRLRNMSLLDHVERLIVH